MIGDVLRTTVLTIQFGRRLMAVPGSEQLAVAHSFLVGLSERDWRLMQRGLRVVGWIQDNQEGAEALIAESQRLREIRPLGRERRRFRGHQP